jgi:hypothetical protein
LTGQNTFVPGRGTTRYKCEAFVLDISRGANAPPHLHRMLCTGSIPGTNVPFSSSECSPRSYVLQSRQRCTRTKLSPKLNYVTCMLYQIVMNLFLKKNGDEFVKLGFLYATSALNFTPFIHKIWRACVKGVSAVDGIPLLAYTNINGSWPVLSHALKMSHLFSFSPFDQPIVCTICTRENGPALIHDGTKLKAEQDCFLDVPLAKC